MTKLLLRLAAVTAVAIGSSACSSVPDWVDPTTWVGDSTPTPAATSDNAEAPDLASLPNKPAPTATPDEQKQVASELAADRSQAAYSAEALRGNPDSSAPPPAPVSASDQASASTDAATPASAPTPAAESSSSTVPSQAATQVASAEPPAAPMQAHESMSAPTVSPSDAELGFKPSTAPPLDASVAQFVPAPVFERYRRGGMSSGTAYADSGRPSRRSRHRRHAEEGVGGPEAMSGAVVANLDALQAPSASPATYADASGTAPAAVVFFPGDGTTLGAQARQKVKEAVAAYEAKGKQGFVKVVGHSSSRTANMPVEEHLALIFKRSQDRADAVAKELIKEGVPADKVLVEAVGDSQPVYYESMPKGEDGNRRAEIFLQG